MQLALPLVYLVALCKHIYSNAHIMHTKQCLKDKKNGRLKLNAQLRHRTHGPHLYDISGKIMAYNRH